MVVDANPKDGKIVDWTDEIEQLAMFVVLSESALTER
jgi:hypothetical protein